jgi:GntR family transcriptional regulator, transcriptional repressor for pyruvate dehydrogenase complex
LKDLLKPLKTDSLKDVFIKRFEEIILSEDLLPGEKLPSERDLALQLGVSRPVVHEGLVDLANKGLLTMKPRAGAIVNDYKKHGSIFLLTSLLNYNKKKFEPKLVKNMLDVRSLFEVEIARLASLNRTDRQLKELFFHIEKEKKCNLNNIDSVLELDFTFHHLLSLATDNLVYPLLLNSFKNFYNNLASEFFEESGIVKIVFDIHNKIVNQVEKKDHKGAAETMKFMLQHGEKYVFEKLYTTK